MKRINSKYTFLLKKVFPVFWFFILLMMIVVVLTHKQNVEAMVIGSLVTCMMIVIGFIIYKFIISKLIDKVCLDGEVLIFKNSGNHIKLHLKDIIDYKYQRYMNPHKVTLTTKQNTKLGKQLSFLAPTSYVPFKKNEDIMELLGQLNERGVVEH